MRTPGKQGVYGQVRGYGLDNACVPHLHLKLGEMGSEAVQVYNLFLAMHLAIARTADPDKVRALEGE
jgi:hypothetical protein